MLLTSLAEWEKVRLLINVNIVYGVTAARILLGAVADRALDIFIPQEL